MNTVEDRMREALASVAIPDVPVPAIESLQRRARRHRLNQAGGGLGSAAFVAMCIVGGMSFGTTGPQPAVQSAQMTRIPASIPGGSGQQWQIARERVGTHTYQAASFLRYGHPCVISTFGTAAPTVTSDGWCPSSAWPVGEVADESTRTQTVGAHEVVEVDGRVPAAARSVVVHIDDTSVTVPAVATPTSDKERFFAAYLDVPSSRLVPVSPVIAVFDGSGRAIEAPSPHNDVLSGDGLMPTHFPGLPSNQVQYSISDNGVQAIVYRTGSTPCVALALHGVIKARTCAPTAPQSGRPLIALRVPKFGRMVMGDAPAWADQLRINGPGSSTQATLGRVNGITDRSFWLTQSPETARGTVIATCAIGDNCTVVQRWVAPTAQ